jgi:MerR family transcriptional regulator, heat shock protein HspR
MNLRRLDDPDYPAYSMGRAASLLNVAPAFLRSLDAEGVLRPERSAGGHRRYSRAQLEIAAAVRALLDDGFSLSAAGRYVLLAEELRRAKGALGRTRSVLRKTEAELAETKDVLARTEEALAEAREQLNAGERTGSRVLGRRSPGRR